MQSSCKAAVKQLLLAAAQPQGCCYLQQRLRIAHCVLRRAYRSQDKKALLSMTASAYFTRFVGIMQSPSWTRVTMRYSSYRA